jgi:hypothetical protein
VEAKINILELKLLNSFQLRRNRKIKPMIPQIKRMILQIKPMILNHFGAPLSFGYICLLVLLFVAVASFVDVNGTMITIDEYEGGEIDGRQLYMNQIV